MDNLDLLIGENVQTFFLNQLMYPTFNFIFVILIQYLNETLSDISFRISPLAFFQGWLLFSIFSKTCSNRQPNFSNFINFKQTPEQQKFFIKKQVKFVMWIKKPYSQTFVVEQGPSDLLWQKYYFKKLAYKNVIKDIFFCKN